MTLSNLKHGTTYYFQMMAWTPLGEQLVSSESSFTTATAYTNPGIANVRDGTSYTFNDAVLTGNVELPDPSDVRVGVTYDSLGSVTGTLTLTPENIAAAVWEAQTEDHEDEGTFGLAVQVDKSIVGKS